MVCPKRPPPPFLHPPTHTHTHTYIEKSAHIYIHLWTQEKKKIRDRELWGIIYAFVKRGGYPPYPPLPRVVENKKKLVQHIQTPRALSRHTNTTTQNPRTPFLGREIGWLELERSKPARFFGGRGGGRGRGRGGICRGGRKRKKKK